MLKVKHLRRTLAFEMRQRELLSRQPATVAQAGEAELPEPVARVSKGPVAFFVKFAEWAKGPKLVGSIDLFTADQLRTYGASMARAARREALEEAAKACQPTNWDQPDDWTEYAKTKAGCAAAIRALIGKD